MYLNLFRVSFVSRLPEGPSLDDYLGNHVFCTVKLQELLHQSLYKVKTLIVPGTWSVYNRSPGAHRNHISVPFAEGQQPYTLKFVSTTYFIQENWCTYEIKYRAEAEWLKNFDFSLTTSCSSHLLTLFTTWESYADCFMARKLVWPWGSLMWRFLMGKRVLRSFLFIVIHTAVHDLLEVSLKSWFIILWLKLSTPFQ